MEMELPQTLGALQQRAASKLEKGAVSQARNALQDGGRAPPTQATRAAIKELVAVETAEEEREATAWQCGQHAARLQGAAAEGVRRSGDDRGLQVRKWPKRYSRNL